MYSLEAWVRPLEPLKEREMRINSTKQFSDLCTLRPAPAYTYAACTHSKSSFLNNCQGVWDWGPNNHLQKQTSKDLKTSQQNPPPRSTTLRVEPSLGIKPLGDILDPNHSTLCFNIVPSFCENLEQSRESHFLLFFLFLPQLTVPLTLNKSLPSAHSVIPPMCLGALWHGHHRHRDFFRLLCPSLVCLFVFFLSEVRLTVGFP